MASLGNVPAGGAKQSPVTGTHSRVPTSQSLQKGEKSRRQDKGGEADPVTPKSSPQDKGGEVDSGIPV